MKINLTLRDKIMYWAIGIVLAIMFITGIGTLILVKSWLVSDLKNVLVNEAHDVNRSISILNGEISVNPSIAWEEHHHQLENDLPVHIFLIDPVKHIIFPEIGKRMIESLPIDLELSVSEDIFSKIKHSSQAYLYYSRPLTHSGINKGWIVVSISFIQVDITLNKLIIWYLSGISILILIVYFITKYWINQTMVYIQTISQKARNLQTKNLSERLPLPRTKDEVYHLAETLNGMLDRIENSIIATRRFFNNASHEIKTPLAIIVAQLERIKNRSDKIHPKDIEMLDYEVGRISKIIDDLGIISKADYTGTILKKDVLWLNDLVIDEIMRFIPRAEQKNISILYPDIPSMTMMGDENWIRILLSNLLDNAVKFSAENGKITVEVEKTNSSFILHILDSGPGVKEDEFKYLTKRFYRSEAAKSSTGSGLGLSIAQWVAEKHDGTIFFKNRKSGGLQVSWEFPIESGT